MVGGLSLSLFGVWKLTLARIVSRRPRRMANCCRQYRCQPHLWPSANLYLETSCASNYLSRAIMEKTASIKISYGCWLAMWDSARWGGNDASLPDVVWVRAHCAWVTFSTTRRQLGRHRSPSGFYCRKSVFALWKYALIAMVLCQKNRSILIYVQWMGVIVVTFSKPQNRLIISREGWRPAKASFIQRYWLLKWNY